MFMISLLIALAIGVICVPIYIFFVRPCFLDLQEDWGDPENIHYTYEGEKNVHYSREGKWEKTLDERREYDYSRRPRSSKTSSPKKD